MMKNKISKLLILIFLLLTLKKVEAAHYNIGYVSLGGGVTTSEKKDFTKTETLLSADGHTQYTYTCTYNYAIGYGDDIYINGYNMNDEEIMKDSISISKENAVPAGTAIGLNMYEKRFVSWEVTKAEVSVKAVAQRKYYRCNYYNRCSGQDIAGTSFGQVGCTHCKYMWNGIMYTDYYNGLYYFTTDERWNYLCNNSAGGCGYASKWGPYYTEDFILDVTDQVTIPESRKTECKELAKDKAIQAANWNVYASYDVKMSDSNDIKATTPIGINTDVANKNKKCYDKNGRLTTQCEFKYSGNKPEADSLTIEFNYIKNTVCINTKNSEVRYENESVNCGANELKVENKTIDGQEHWHYFIPLNAKSYDYVEINMMPSGNRTLSAGQCNAVMIDYPVTLDRNGEIVEENLNGTLGTMYTNLITTVSGGDFKGDYCYIDHTGKKECKENEAISKDYKEMKNNGCKLTSKIKIPIKQLFYNEVENTSTKKITFNGFNFYYKPIDDSGADKNTDQTKIIFPNGKPNTTLWDDWYTAKKNNKTTSPDLSNSYTNTTYVANNISARKVRDYNSTYTYTSWENMNTTGLSQFIEKEGIVTRNGSQKVYKLGCGPANANKKLPDGTTNHLYIKGCELS